MIAPSGTALERWRPAPGAWDVAAARHLCARAGFGASREELEHLVSIGVDDAISACVADRRSDPELREGARALLGRNDIDALGAWWMALLLSGRGSFTERLTLFWHDHFATSWAKVGDIRLMHRQNELFRERGAGDFRELLHAVARDPAMLVWLDGDANRAGAPNENFAREVMELFALGIGNYTEHDIQEAARAFTGWGTQGRAFRDRPAHHDGGEKTIFGERGRFRGDDALDRILAQPACPRHVARRLLQEFAVPSPGEPEVEQTARILVSEGWNIARTIEAILRSRLFFSPAARRARISGPVELVVTTVRRLGASVPPRAAYDAAARMGQTLFQPPSVKGWDGMRSWINAGTWIARHNALVRLVRADGQARDGVSLDLPHAFGWDGGDAAACAVRTLVPDLAGGRFESAVRAALDGVAPGRRALAEATALVLTAPEYHLT